MDLSPILVLFQLFLSISASADLQLVIEDVKILHDITTQKDMTHEPWPVLFVELDVGNVCFTTKAPNLANFDREYFPECNQLLCIGLVGPISVWTRYKLLDALANCVTNGMLGTTPPNCEKLPGRFMEIDIPTPPPKIMIVDFLVAPGSNFETVLTDPKILNLSIAKRSRFIKALRVVVDSFAEGDLSFCLVPQKDIIPIVTGPHAEKYYKNCDMICPVFKEHFFIFEDSKIVDEILPCFGTHITHMGKFPASLEFQRDVKTGKVKILVNKKPTRWTNIAGKFTLSPAKNSEKLKSNSKYSKNEL